MQSGAARLASGRGQCCRTRRRDAARCCSAWTGVGEPRRHASRDAVGSLTLRSRMQGLCQPLPACLHPTRPILLSDVLLHGQNCDGQPSAGQSKRQANQGASASQQREGLCRSCVACRLLVLIAAALCTSARRLLCRLCCCPCTQAVWLQPKQVVHCFVATLFNGSRACLLGGAAPRTVACFWPWLLRTLLQASPGMNFCLTCWLRLLQCLVRLHRRVQQAAACCRHWGCSWWPRLMCRLRSCCLLRLAFVRSSAARRTVQWRTTCCWLLLSIKTGLCHGCTTDRPSCCSCHLLLGRLRMLRSRGLSAASCARRLAGCAGRHSLLRLLLGLTVWRR